MRNTKQKQFVLNFIKQSRQHPTIKDISKFAAKNNIKIGTTTIYRVLYNLTRSGEVKKVVTKDGITHYDYAHNDHIHLVCNVCAKIIDVPSEQAFKSDFQSAYGFSVSPQDIALFGVCNSCVKAEKQQKKYKS